MERMIFWALRPSSFLNLLFVISQAQLRDYILRELNRNKKERALIEKKLQELIVNPMQYPEAFVEWKYNPLSVFSVGSVVVLPAEYVNKVF